MSEAEAQVIDLARLDDAAFERLYKERIEPCFIGNENDRLAAVDQFKSRLGIGGAIALVLSVVGYLTWRQWDIVAVILFMTSILAGIIAYQPLAKVGRTLRRVLRCAGPPGLVVQARLQTMSWSAIQVPGVAPVTQDPPQLASTRTSVHTTPMASRPQAA